MTPFREIIGKSSSLWSRPFVHAVLNQASVSPSERMYEEFRAAVYEFGLDLIGGHDRLCLDVGARIAPQVDLGIRRGRPMADFFFSDFATPYLQSGCPEVAGWKTLFLGKAVDPSRQLKSVVFSGADLLPCMEKIWAADWQVDPRLTMAEEIFNRNVSSSAPVVVGKPPAFARSLSWMALPANAQRVAHAFLYSRVATMLGERNPLSVVVADRLDAKLAEGQGVEAFRSELQFLPYLIFVMKDKGLPWERCYARPSKGGVRELTGNAACYVDAYRALRCGAWAHERLSSYKAVLSS